MNVTDWPSVMEAALRLRIVVLILFTVCVNADETLTISFVSPTILGTGTIASGHAIFTSSSLSVDNHNIIAKYLGGLVLVSLNCIVPVAVFGDTVAVKVTDWPNTAGLTDDD